MPTDIIMPQMGESIVEGTITKWLKKPGDKVQRDEPLFEISTDKVDAEIPAPASGVLQEIKVSEGSTVGVNTVVGTISVDGEAAAAPAKAAPAASAPAPEAKPAGEKRREEARGIGSRARRQRNGRPTAGGRWCRRSPFVPPRTQDRPRARRQSFAGLRYRTWRPHYQAGHHGLHRASGFIGRLLRNPLLSPRLLAAARPAAPPAPAAYPGDLVPMTNMRKIIAQRMIESRRTSAHVHCMYEVDFTRIVTLRAKQKNAFEQRHGVRLTFMPFFVRAAIIALQQWPILNASLEGDNIRYHRQINVGIAVALDWGLIVPVLKNAGDLNFLGLQRGITDLGERARTKKLKPEDVEGSTFTVTNPGQFGAVFGLPIINQPNSAIMGVGGITKQPLVVTDKEGNDSIAIRSVVHLTLGYDHRLIDGAVADQYMALVKKTLENWNEEVG